MRPRPARDAVSPINHQRVNDLDTADWAMRIARRGQMCRRTARIRGQREMRISAPA